MKTDTGVKQPDMYTKTIKWKEKNSQSEKKIKKLGYNYLCVNSHPLTSKKDPF